MNDNLWTYYRVKFNFITKLCGSTPSNKEIVKIWLEARQPKVMPPSSRSIDEIQAEVVATLAEPAVEEEFSQLVFQRVDGYLALRTATIRAHMKDCSRILSPRIGRIEGEKSLAVKIKDAVYHDEQTYWTPI